MKDKELIESIVSNITVEDEDFTPEQLARIDEVENATHQLCKTMLSMDELVWDIKMIGEIADLVAAYLNQEGWSVNYPAKVKTAQGVKVFEFVDEQETLEKRKEEE